MRHGRKAFPFSLAFARKVAAGSRLYHFAFSYLIAGSIAEHLA